MKKVQFETTVRVLKEMDVDNELIGFLDQMSVSEKEQFINMVSSSMNDEVVSFFAICNRKLYTEYLKNYQKRFNPQLSVMNLVN